MVHIFDSRPPHPPSESKLSSSKLGASMHGWYLFFARLGHLQIASSTLTNRGEGGLGVNGASNGWYLFSQKPVPDVGFKMNGGCWCVLVGEWV